MTLRQTPKAATWFLKQFDSNSKDESVTGDLTEQYQRGRGPIWYWRQVLVIVFVGLYREVRREKLQFLGSLFRTWCVWGGLQFMAAGLMIQRYRSIHPIGSDHGLAGNLMPLVGLRVINGDHTRVWDISVLMVTLNLLTLLLVGRYIASSSKVNPRSLLLACLTSFVVADIGFIAMYPVLIYLNPPGDVGFLITNLIALPLVPALLLIGGIGGMRGLSPVPPHFKGRRESL